MDDIRDSFSRLKGKVKRRLAGSKRKPERTGADAGGNRADPTSSLPQAGPRVVVGGGRDREGWEAGVDGGEAGQKYPHSRPSDGEVGVGSGPSRRTERVHTSPPTPSIPRVRKPDKARPSRSVKPTAAADEKKSNWKSTAFATTKLLLRGVRDSADAFGPLKSVAGGLCFILDNCERTQANGQAIESLAPRVRAIAESLCAPIPEGDIEEQERRNKLGQKLEEVRRDIAFLARQGKAEGFLNNVENVDKIGGMVEDIRDAIMEYQTSLQQDIYNKSCLLIESADLVLLDRMCHTADASYLCGNRQGCLRGTRKDVLQEIERWLMNEQDQRVFWLNGLAGTGKSTIAQTFAETTFADGKLGASFFCSRDFENRSNLQAVFPTLAFQLAYQYPRFRRKLLRVLRASPDVGRESLCSQMEKLIAGPLKATRVSTLIIIDALDECKDEEPASAILSILSRYVNEIPNVKFFITGRPEPRIRSGFRLKLLRPITEVLRLHDVKRSSVDSDIKLFYRVRLTEIAKTRSDCDFAQEWPNPSDINILCEKAAGLFIYASTVVKFVEFKNRTPTEQLDRIISLPQSTVYEGRSGIDLLYTQVLEQGVDGMDADTKEISSRFKSVVGAVLLVLNPLSVRALSDLLGISNISTTLRSLHSLLLVPDSIEDPVHVFHKSFPDFLMDPLRCKDKRFLVQPTVHHAEILLLCLNLMKKRLKRNICNLSDYAILSKVKGLSTQQKILIGDGLEYACCFWTKHLLRIPGNSSYVGEVYKAVNGFFTTHLLHWIEVLVLTGNLGVGVYAMNDVEQWCTLAGVSCEWTNDSQRFLLEYFDTIHDSPSQIYHSALPFSPSSSWLQNFYSAELLQEIKVVKGLPAEWGTCSRTVSLDKCPQTLSCQNNTIAVGLEHRDIVIFDAITGSQIVVLSGHTNTVNSLTFSSDGMSLVSGSDDGSVKLWDVQTGGVVKTFHGHTQPVWSVSISADYTMIASGSTDNTIRLWDIHTEECHCLIQQEGSVKHVTFSPTNPQYFVSVSGNKIWPWDTNGCGIGPVYAGSHSTFSLDGTLFVSCNRKVVTVQNSDSREIVAEFRVANGYAECCCFSPNGRLVAIGASNTAYVWDIAGSDPYLVETFVGHTNNITSIAFSSPSSLISASHDQSIKFWKIGTSTGPVVIDQKSTPPISAPIESITLQAKDWITISSDSDGVVRVWDISTGYCKASFQTPANDLHKRDARLVNNRLIFVWHTNKKSYLWNAESGHFHYADRKTYIWEAQEGKLLHTVDCPDDMVEDIRISGDGSKVFRLTSKSIEAWSTATGRLVGKAEAEDSVFTGPLIVDGSKVWVHHPQSEYKGWRFMSQAPSPVLLSAMPPNRQIYLHGTKLWDTSLSRIKDTVTGKVFLQLPERFLNPVDVQWNGQYLVACFKSKEVLILDIRNVLL